MTEVLFGALGALAALVLLAGGLLLGIKVCLTGIAACADLHAINAKAA